MLRIHAKPEWVNIHIHLRVCWAQL